METLPKRGRRQPQITEEDTDLPFDEVAPTIPEADILDQYCSLLTDFSATDIVVNAEALLPQGGRPKVGHSYTKTPGF